MGTVDIFMPPNTITFKIKGDAPSKKEKQRITSILVNMSEVPRSLPGTGQRAEPRQTVTSQIGRETFASGGAAGATLAVARGAMRGTIAGSRGGPIGMAVAGVGGAIAGGGLYYLGDELEARIRGIPKDITPEQVLMGLATEATIEGGMQGVFGLGFKLTSWGFKGFGHMIGMARPHVKKILEQTRQAGLPPSALLGLTPFVQGVIKVGGVIPIVGSGVRAAVGKMEIAASTGILNFLNRVAPVVDIPDMIRKIGKELSVRDLSSIRARNEIVNAALVGFREVSRRAGDPAIIPVESIVKAASSALRAARDMPKVVRTSETQSGFTETRVRNPPPQEPKGGFQESSIDVTKKSSDVTTAGTAATTKEGESTAVTFAGETTTTGTQTAQVSTLEDAGVPVISNTLVKQLENIELLASEGNISATQLTTMMEGFLAAVRKEGGVGSAEYNAYNEVLGGIFEALRNVDTKGLTILRATSLRGAAVRLSKSWTDAKALETSAVLSGLNVPKGFWQRPGPISKEEFEELAEIIVNAPEAFFGNRTVGLDLDDLIGPANRKALARLYISKALDPAEGTVNFVINKQGIPKRAGSTEVIAFDASRARSKLGLDVPETVGDIPGRATRAALDRFLKGTGLSAAKLDGFLKAVEQSQAVVASDPSSFLARRMVLSGKIGIPSLGGGGILAAAGGGALAVAGSLIDLGAFLITGNLFVKLMSTETGLRLLQTGLKFRPNVRAAQLLAARIARVVGEDVVGSISGE